MGVFRCFASLPLLAVPLLMPLVPATAFGNIVPNGSFEYGSFVPAGTCHAASYV